MKYSHVPPFQNVVAFLKSKGWTIDESKSPYFVMTSPKLKPSSQIIDMYLPAYDPGENLERKRMYARQIWNVMEHLGEIYETDTETLCRQLSDQSTSEFFSPKRQAIATAA
ncbi:MAG: hypothetical protein AAB316_24380 [Bacteroidota bacterium]